MEALKDYLSGVPITHGQPILFKKSTFQAHAAPARTEDDVAWVLNFLRRSEKWKGCQYMPHAYRIAMDVGAAAVAESDDVAEALPAREGSEDHGESGAGDKLLHLLRRWGIQNVVLVLTRFDAGPPGRLGAQRFRVLQDRAKAVLEQCYVEHLDTQATESVPCQYGEEHGLEGGAPAMGENAHLLEVEDESRGGHVHEHLWGDNAGVVLPQMDLAALFGSESAARRALVTDPRRVFAPSTISASAGRGPRLPMGQCVLDGSLATKASRGRHAGFGGCAPPKRGRVAHFLAKDGIAPTQEQVIHGAAKSRRRVREEQSRVRMATRQSEMATFPAQDMDSLGLPVDVLTAYDTRPMPSLGPDTLDTLRATRQPNAMLLRALQCVACLLAHPSGDWASCREMALAPSFRAQLATIDAREFGPERVAAVREVLADCEIEPSAVRRQSELAAELFEWVTSVVQMHDLHYAEAASVFGSDGTDGGSLFGGPSGHTLPTADTAVLALGGTAMRGNHAGCAVVPVPPVHVTSGGAVWHAPTQPQAQLRLLRKAVPVAPLDDADRTPTTLQTVMLQPDSSQLPHRPKSSSLFPQ